MTPPELHLADWRDNLGDAAHYSYAPEPEGLRDQPLPVRAWTESGSGSLAILPCTLKI